MPSFEPFQGFLFLEEISTVFDRLPPAFADINIAKDKLVYYPPYQRRGEDHANAIYENF
jgi:hypothetical protein